LFFGSEYSGRNHEAFSPVDLLLFTEARIMPHEIKGKQQQNMLCLRLSYLVYTVFTHDAMSIYSLCHVMYPLHLFDEFEKIDRHPVPAGNQ
jgi:hypothetical protein